MTVTLGLQKFRWMLRSRWFIVLLFLAGLNTGCGPIWLLDSPSAHRIAKEQRKPLLVYFKAWDSPQHRNMKLKVFENPDIKRELMETVNLEVEQAWALEDNGLYEVLRPQVCVLCTPDGVKVAAKDVSTVPTEKDFLAWIKQAKVGARYAANQSRPATTQPTRNTPSLQP